METAAPLAFSYIRFSHPDQARGDSLRRQTDGRVEQFCQRHRLTLDTTLSLRDLGVSAFRGRHRSDKHDLGKFLELVRRGRIPVGSYLIVENLDRLSREEERPALRLWMDLLDAGINIVQLEPETIFRHEKSDMLDIMRAIMELSRGHGESKRKSDLIGPAWREKKRLAAAEKTPLTKRVPGWLKLVDGQWEVKQEAARTVRHIYHLATAGYGIGVIVKRLNADHIPTLGRADFWAHSSVAKILSNRAVVGEYQPYTGRGGQRKPDGKPIPGYYPRVIEDEEWFAAQAAMASRRSKPGRPAKEHVNLFAHLLHDARSQGTLQLVDKGERASGHILVPYQGRQGVKGSQNVSFPLRTFEPAILKCLHEIDPREVMGQEDEGKDRTLELQGRLDAIEAREEEIKAKLRNPRLAGLDALVDVLATIADEKKALTEQLREARQADALPLGDAWDECQTLIGALDAAPDPEDARLRLRAALRRIVEGIWCLFVARGALRVAAVQVWFADGATHRDYLILHRPAVNGFGGRKEGGWWSRSLASAVEPGDLDLRNREHAADLERALLSLDLKTLDGRCDANA
jgi:DNA invertase Pin-like site-specific DNA recombinase